MPIYEFRCKGCDEVFEDTDPSRLVNAHHAEDDGRCGPIIRVWGGRVNIANLKEARG